MRRDIGFCQQCGTCHPMQASGAFTSCGVLCSLGLIVGRTRPEVGGLFLLGSLFFGDTVERWVMARCPSCCGRALRLLATS